MCPTRGLFFAYDSGMPSRQFPLAVAGVLSLILLADGLAVQQQPTFRTATRTVPVYATVTDREGRLVPGLEQSDFEIYDNGRKQDLTMFDNQAVPFSAVLALDTSASMTMNLSLVQDAAVQFVIRMTPEDKGVINFFNSKIQFSQGLTHDRDSLVNHIRNEMQVGNSTRLWDAIEASLDMLADTAGRRVVVALTDGDDSGSSIGDGAVRDRAQRENVMIYAIGIESRFHNGLQWTISRPGRPFRRMATETGGGFFELKKSTDLGSTFTRVIQELHSQYLLGFSPAALDGKEHKLEVRLTRPGLTARARNSYLAR